MDRFKYVENKVFGNHVEMQEMEFHEDAKDQQFKRINTWKTGITPQDHMVVNSDQQIEEGTPRYFESQETDRNLNSLNTDRKLLPQNRPNTNMSDPNKSVDNKLSINQSFGSKDGWPKSEGFRPKVDMKQSSI